MKIILIYLFINLYFNKCNNDWLKTYNLKSNFYKSKNFFSPFCPNTKKHCCDFNEYYKIININKNSIIPKLYKFKKEYFFQIDLLINKSKIVIEILKSDYNYFLKNLNLKEYKTKGKFCFKKYKKLEDMNNDILIKMKDEFLKLFDYIKNSLIKFTCDICNEDFHNSINFINKIIYLNDDYCKKTISIYKQNINIVNIEFMSFIKDLIDNFDCVNNEYNLKYDFNILFEKRKNNFNTIAKCLWSENDQNNRNFCFELCNDIGLGELNQTFVGDIELLKMINIYLNQYINKINFQNNLRFYTILNQKHHNYNGYQDVTGRNLILKENKDDYKNGIKDYLVYLKFVTKKEKFNKNKKSNNNSIKLIDYNNLVENFAKFLNLNNKYKNFSPKKKSRMLKYFSNISSNIWKGTKYVSKKVWKGAKWVAKKIWNGTKWIAKKMWKGARWITKKVWNGSKWVVKKVWKGFKWIGKKIRKFFKYFKKKIFKEKGQWTEENYFRGGKKYMKFIYKKNKKLIYWHFLPGNITIKTFYKKNKPIMRVIFKNGKTIGTSFYKKKAWNFIGFSNLINYDSQQIYHIGKYIGENIWIKEKKFSIFIFKNRKLIIKFIADNNKLVAVTKLYENQNCVKFNIYKKRQLISYLYFYNIGNKKFYLETKFVNKGYLKLENSIKNLFEKFSNKVFLISLKLKYWMSKKVPYNIKSNENAYLSKVTTKNANFIYNNKEFFEVKKFDYFMKKFLKFKIFDIQPKKILFKNKNIPIKINNFKKVFSSENKFNPFNTDFNINFLRYPKEEVKKLFIKKNFILFKKENYKNSYNILNNLLSSYTDKYFESITNDINTDLNDSYN